MKPTIVLIHGAFAESGSWNAVTDALTSFGYYVIAAPKPLRNLDAAAASLADLIRAIEGPVVVVRTPMGAR